MGLWLGDYVQLQNEIDYFKFALSLNSSEEENNSATEEIQKREQQAKEFRSIVNVLEGTERTIFLKKYVEGKKQREIAEELNLSKNYINVKAVEVKHKIEFAIRLLGEREKEIE